MRQFWLKDIKTQAVWNFTPTNPREEYGGCVFASVKGLGFENNIEQTQVSIDYFIDRVASKNKNITGILYFKSPKHKESFQEFIGDFSKQFELHYSPDGSIIASDQISKSWYKNIIINKLDTGERNKLGWYECDFSMTTQSDVWKRDIELISNGLELFGTPLTYPYFYKTTYGGAETLALDITNFGRETGCTIEIVNTNDSGNIENPSWILINKYTDIMGNEQQLYQYAKFNVKLRPNRKLIIDSNPLNQRALIESMTENIYNYENIRNNEEIDFDYINYITIPNGQNTIYFNIGGGNQADISVKYSEMREFI